MTRPRSEPRPPRLFCVGDRVARLVFGNGESVACSGTIVSHGRWDGQWIYRVHWDYDNSIVEVCQVGIQPKKE